MARKFDVVIVGSGPAGLGAAFYLIENSPSLQILLIEKSNICTGGLRNDCKQNYTFPIGFPLEFWKEETANSYLSLVKKYLKPKIQSNYHLSIYQKRAAKLDVKLIDIKQSHVGTDRAIQLIKDLYQQLVDLGVEFRFGTEIMNVDSKTQIIQARTGEEIEFKKIILAPGRIGFSILQKWMKELSIPFLDNVVDIGVRIETKEMNYPIVQDYYDPKFIFPEGTRTFCTNSGASGVVKEKYEHYYSVNGHSFSVDRKPNGLVNFAILKTISLTDPVVSGHQFARILGQMAMQLSGGQPMMQRIGDFRLGKRSTRDHFNEDLYDFEPTLKDATPGDVSLAIPAKILRSIWKSLKMLDTVVPGILHPSTILYYPEIKTYANKPEFIDSYFQVKENIYMIGDGAGTSRGITAAWASGIRAAEGILK